MKALNFFAVVAMLAGSAQAKVYSFKDFSADFPAQPTVKIRQTDDGGTVTVFSAVQSNYLFGITKTTYPRSYDLEQAAIFHSMKQGKQAGTLDNKPPNITTGKCQGFLATRSVYYELLSKRKTLHSKMVVYTPAAIFEIDHYIFWENQSTPDELAASSRGFLDSFTLKFSAATAELIEPACPEPEPEERRAMPVLDEAREI